MSNATQWEYSPCATESPAHGTAVAGVADLWKRTQGADYGLVNTLHHLGLSVHEATRRILDALILYSIPRFFPRAIHAKSCRQRHTLPLGAERTASTPDLPVSRQRHFDH